MSNELEARVINLFQNVSQGELEVRQPAEAQLNGLRSQVGFHACLVSMCLNPARPLAIRQAAVLFFKNSVAAFVTRCKQADDAGKAFAAERDAIKRMVTTALVSGSDQEMPGPIEIQLALSLAIWTRNEWPQADAFPAIKQALESSNPLIMHRGLVTLSEVLKQLESLRLPQERQAFANACGQLLPFVRSRWGACLESLLRNGSQRSMASEQGQLGATATLAIKWTKLMRRLVVNGLPVISPPNSLPPSSPSPSPSASAPSAANDPNILAVLEALKSLLVLHATLPLPHDLPLLFPPPSSSSSAECSVDHDVRDDRDCAEPEPSANGNGDNSTAIEVGDAEAKDGLDRMRRVWLNEPVKAIIGQLGQAIVQCIRSYPLSFRPYLPVFFAFFLATLRSSAHAITAAATINNNNNHHHQHHQHHHSPPSPLLSASSSSSSDSSASSPPLARRRSEPELDGILRDLQRHRQRAQQTALQRMEDQRAHLHPVLVGAIAGITEMVSCRAKEVQADVDALCGGNGSVLELAELIVSHFLAVTFTDVKSWMDDPEIFLQEDDKTQTDEKVGSCALSLLSRLIKRFGGALAPYLLRMLVKFANQPFNTLAHRILETSPEMQQALRRDAVYAAFGCAPHDLLPHLTQAGFSLEKWYATVLSKDIVLPVKRIKVVSRRAVWLCGQWASMHTEPIRRDLYARLLACLGDPDLVLRMEVVRCLERLLDENFELGGDVLVANFPAFVPRLFALIAQLDNLDFKNEVLYVLRTMISKLGSRITGFGVSALSEGFPQLWSEGDPNLRGGLLTLLTSLVQALGKNSVALQSLLCPLIAFCISPQQQSSSPHLVRPVCQLWLSMLHHTPSPFALPQMLQPFASTELPGALLAVLDVWINGVDIPEAEDLILQIAESSLLWGGLPLLTSRRIPLTTRINALSKRLFTDPPHKRNIRAVTALVGVWEAYSVLHSQVADSDFSPMLPTLQLMVNDLVALSRTPKPDQKTPPEVVDEYRRADFSARASLPLLARVMFVRGHWLCDRLRSAGTQAASMILSTLLTFWLDPTYYLRMSPLQRKLTVLAAVQVTIEEPALVSQMTDILKFVLNASRDPAGDAKVAEPGVDNEVARRAAFDEVDPAHRISGVFTRSLSPLRAFALRRLQDCIQKAEAAAQALQTAFSSLDGDLLRQLQS